MQQATSTDTTFSPADDTQLLAACAEFRRCDKRMIEVERRKRSYSDDEITQINDDWYRAMDQVMALPARTAPGLQARAAVALRCLKTTLDVRHKLGYREEWLAFDVLNQVVKGLEA